MKDTANNAKSQAIEVIAENIATQVIKVMTGIVLFILTRVVLVVLKFITKTLSNFPIIKQFNELGGIVYGALKGFIIIYLILTLMFFVISVKGNKTIADNINKTYITKFLYDNNIIIKYCLLGKSLL